MGVPVAQQRTGSDSVDARRYKIVSILGQGGFGTVYRGRLEGSEGFVKDVAIKLLTDLEPSEDVLGRFRDEARILGLLHDRNIVSVDPPTRLGGRWAVVMEYVHGSSCEDLIRQNPLPPAVALEIIEEVARTLDNLWSHEGEDGQPMHLLHRDIKPPNIQVTPTGQVKILDFGIAKADFGGRETKTTNHIGGTMGYIAPERLEGEEGPKGDIYSLGIVLYELVTGGRPGKSTHRIAKGAPPPPPLVREVLALADKMRAMEPTDRPSAREVETMCRQIRAKCPPPDLRDWCRENVKPNTGTKPDALVGKMLTETMSKIARMPKEIPPELRIPEKGKGPSWVLVGLALALLLLVGGGLVIGLLGGAGVVAVMFAGSSTGDAVVVADPTSTRPPDPPVDDDPDGTAAVATADPATTADPSTTASETPGTTLAPETTSKPANTTSTTKPKDKPATTTTVVTPPATQTVVVVPTVTDPPPETVATPPAAQTGTVTVSGDAISVTLTGGGRSLSPGDVPAGSYEISADFGAGSAPAGKVTVSAGQTVSLKCNAQFKRCMVK